MEEALKEIIRVMYQQYSMDISCYEESFLVQSIDKRLVANSISGHEKYSGRLAEDHMEAEDLFNSLKICYSEFFRDPLTFNLLEQIVLPNIIEEKIKSGCTEIRIWSVGCSAGQEAYSVAMLLDELIEMRSIPLHFRIFATDNSEAEVLSVKNGTYNISSLQQVRLKHILKYFIQKGDTYAVVSRLREKIDFSLYDLLDKNSICPPVSIYGDFDLVLCCNLLYYYRPHIWRLILDKIYRCLYKTGFLVTSDSEKTMVQEAGGFRAITTPLTIFQKIIPTIR